MKVHLMYRDRSLDLEASRPANAETLEQDLELNTLLEVMAAGDAYLREQAERAVLSSLTDTEAILYRQAVLRDCLDHPEILRRLYAVAIEGLESKRKAWHFWFRDSPEALVQKSLKMLELLADSLKQLRELAQEQRAAFSSDGFTRLFATLESELDDGYLTTVDDHLRELAFRRGVLVSAELGRANRGTRYVLRRPRSQRLRDRVTPGRAPSYSFTLPARDEHGMRALSELQDRGLTLVANAVAQSTDHILGFFEALRAELGFYLACLNLHEQLAEKAGPTCFPVPFDATVDVLSTRGLYDVSLAFHLASGLIGNDVDADGKRLIMITGANQGGKSTFLRSLGLAQLMMQAGMFVGAESFRANVVRGVFTHFKREEDASMTRGKLEEELSRMSEIADLINPNCLLLCNESFAATNEREGSEIARQVVRAMTEGNVKVLFVTHLYDLADSLYRERIESALFLRAERQHDGRRTFRLAEGEPLPTSYGQDSYRRIFATPSNSSPGAS